jgi:glutamate racemase
LVERGVDTVILGCTHYPLLSGLLQLELGPDVVLVSSAEETAKDVYAELLGSGLERSGDDPPEHTFLATGDPGTFQRLAQVFLGPELTDVRAAQAVPVGGGAWS